jgi:hypothetical protein
VLVDLTQIVQAQAARALVDLLDLTAQAPSWDPSPVAACSRCLPSRCPALSPLFLQQRCRFGIHETRCPLERAMTVGSPVWCSHWWD